MQKSGSRRQNHFFQLSNQDRINQLQEENTQLRENIHLIDENNHLKEGNNQLQELNKQLQEENFQLREVEVHDTKRMEEKLKNLLESYGERSRYAHSWST